MAKLIEAKLIFTKKEINEIGVADEVYFTKVAQATEYDSFSSYFYENLNIDYSLHKNIRVAKHYSFRDEYNLTKCVISDVEYNVEKILTDRTSSTMSILVLQEII